MKSTSLMTIALFIGLFVLLIFIGCANESNDNDDNVDDDDNDDDEENNEIAIPTGNPIDAILLNDGSLLVLYTSGAYDTEYSSGLVLFNALLEPEWSLLGHFSFPHTLDLKDNYALIADSMNERLVIMDLETKEIQEIKNVIDGQAMWPNDADFTESGDILISDLYSGSIIKITIEGELLWSVRVDNDFSDGVHDPDELPNSHLIYCLSISGQVAEADEFGEVVWSYGEDLHWPKTVQRLDNGNTLIGDMDRVIEVTAEGEVVWEYVRPIPGGMNYTRENDGNTLDSTNCVKLIAPDGTIVWSLPNRYYNPLTLQEDEPNHRLAILRSIGYL